MSGLIQASFKRTFKQKRLCLSYCENHPNRRLLEEPPSLAQVAKSLMRTVPHLLCNITACPRRALETSLHSLKTPPLLPSPSRPSGALIVVGSKQMKAPSCYTGLLYGVSSVPHPNDDVTHCVGPTKWLITVTILLIGWVYKEFLQSHLDLMYQYEANVNWESLSAVCLNPGGKKCQQHRTGTKVALHVNFIFFHLKTETTWC